MAGVSWGGPGRGSSPIAAIPEKDQVIAIVRHPGTLSITIAAGWALAVAGCAVRW